MGSSVAAPEHLSETGAIDALAETRERTLALVKRISDEDLERVHTSLLSPLVWDLGHIAAFEDLWLVHRYGGRPLLRDDLADVYDAFETPRASRGDLAFLRTAAAFEYLEEVHERTVSVIEERGVADGFLHELVIRHEQQHNETMLQTMQIAHLDGFRTIGACAHRASQSDTGLELIEIPAGACTIGARARGFAYDNERPRHRTDVCDYLIGRTPITNATYLTFVEGGGYERREWWSDEGWSWKEEYDITRPGGWTADLRSEWRLGRLEPLEPDQPVVHVSWFEADAFARAHNVRLPTEFEWEKAATWDQDKDQARTFPWGEETPRADQHANVDQLSAGPVPVGSLSGGASPCGADGMIGDVWEWTSSHFNGYPGFKPHPYKQYSQVFFGTDYRVLRGGSWATRARVISPSFRNWDYPQRRQIFSGIRIARDTR